jgi:hypothetical protein
MSDSITFDNEAWRMYFVTLKVSGMFFHLIIFLTFTCLWSNGLLLFFIDHYIVYIYNLCFFICLIIEGSTDQGSKLKVIKLITCLLEEVFISLLFSSFCWRLRTVIFSLLLLNYGFVTFVWNSGAFGTGNVWNSGAFRIYSLIDCIIYQILLVFRIFFSY